MCECDRVAYYLANSPNDEIGTVKFREACYAYNVDPDSFTQEDLKSTATKIESDNLMEEGKTMEGFLLSIEILLKNGTLLIFEGSGSQELGRINYFSGWPMVSISPKQLVHASSVEELIQLLAKNVKDIEDDEVYIFTESNPVESDLDEETFDAYDFVQLIKDNVNDISDIASVSMISQEYGEFRFFRKYVYDIASDNYSCSMLGVTNSPCDNAEDEEEFADVADLYAGLIPTILQFADKSECTITQKERFCRDADEEDIYGFRGCIVEREELLQKD